MVLSVKFFCRECRPSRTGAMTYLPLDQKWNEGQILSKVSGYIDWCVFYVQNSLKLWRFRTPLLSCRFVTLPKTSSSFGNQCTNSPVFEISAWKVRFNFFTYLSTLGQLFFAAEGMLGGPFWTCSMFCSWRFFGILALALYEKEWTSTFWWSETMGNGRNYRSTYR